ncbi:alpha/beta hydrolase [Helicobacter sp. MIT 05-5293]|uniref:alpha/beta hydrolase n=1 Tax=Helicobacter sp. MIT 05-5293 TaxID=1548149 RepID=UPI0006907271|nr:alpha/beta hydrolase-fold protein [Helicobacter sp. MIT 05-5293]TLD81002.1 alpha/beta hydrolase [Helicobacter sp. MIT 05-5293]
MTTNAQSSLATHPISPKNIQKWVKIIILLFLNVIALDAKPSQEIPPISDQSHTLFEIQSLYIRSKTNTNYHIQIAKPHAPAPQNGYPILYMLDGNAFFPRALDIFISIWRQYPQITIPIIIGIGHDSPLAFDTKARTFDYMPTLDSQLAAKFSGGGGAKDFLDFITTKLLPHIHKNYSIDSQKSAFFGHSFGGIFALFVLFNAPQTFSHYISASPSLWWGEASFIPTRTPLLTHYPTSIIITRGSKEVGKDTEVINAQKLALTLSQQSPNPASVVYIELEGKTHGGSIPDAMSVAIKNLLCAPNLCPIPSKK